MQVIDTTSPSLTCPVDQFGVSNEDCEFTIPDYTPLGSAVDFCSAGTIPVTQNPAPGTVVSVNTMIFLQATDSNGNTGACSFNVILSDVIINLNMIKTYYVTLNLKNCLSFCIVLFKMSLLIF